MTVFLIIIAVLLISLTAVTMFLLQKEIEKRKFTEDKFQRSQYSEEMIRKDLEELKKQYLIMEAKNKEADERINELMDEIELEHGLREEMKREAVSMKENLEKEAKAKAELQAKLNEKIQQSDKEIAAIQLELDTAAAEKKDLEAKLDSLELQNQALEQTIKEIQMAKQAVIQTQPRQPAAANTEQPEVIPTSTVPATLNPSQLTQLDSEEKVELETIIIDNSPKEGRVMSVDTDTEFVVINIGSKQGLRIGDILSVYRGSEFLGEIRATRIQPEMAAADILPPLTSKVIRKNDQVVYKPQ